MEVVNVDTTSEKFDNEAVFALIRISLWQEAIPMPDETDWQYLYDFFDTHALLALPADHLKELGVPEEIYARWKKEIYRYVCHNGLITQVQDKVVGCLRGIPVAVIKGTSAARYYPVPDYRTLGDVDLLVKPEDYDDAAKKIKAAGYAEVTGRSEKKTGRHRSFSENNIRVELHRHFSVDRLPEKVKTLDERLLCALKPDDPVLPDELNGLIILTHVAQHMESGIGLRQIIDWMLFVDKYLDDAHWENGFCALTESVGLTKFAKYVTRMCQLYLGLSDGITWCLGGGGKHLLRRDDGLYFILRKLRNEPFFFGIGRRQPASRAWPSDPVPAPSSASRRTKLEDAAEASGIETVCLAVSALPVYPSGDKRTRRDRESQRNFPGEQEEKRPVYGHRTDGLDTFFRCGRVA